MLAEVVTKHMAAPPNTWQGPALSISSPDIASFAIGSEQLFLLLGCDGLWKVFSGDAAVEWLHERLPKMDTRRAELAAALDDPAAAASLTKEAIAARRAERESTSEEGLLRQMVHEAVHVRHAKDNVTALLVRLDVSA